MNVIGILVLLLFVAFLIFVGRQSASVQRIRKSRRGLWDDAGSDLSILSTGPPQNIPHTSPDPIQQLNYHNPLAGNYAADNVVDSGVNVGSVDYGRSGDSTGGDLGGALAGAIDEGGSSFGGSDSGSDYHNAPVGDHANDNVVSSVDYGSSGDSTGGGLGSALADTIDSGGSSFGGFDSSSDFSDSSDSSDGDSS